MKTAKTFIDSRPVIAYFVLTFLISWGGVFILVGPGGIPGTQAQTAALFPLVYLLTVAGPIISGLLLTGFLGGRTGFRELWSRLLNWRVGARWYVIALLTAPLTVLATLLGLSLFSSQYLPGILTAHAGASHTGMLTAGVGFVAGISIFNGIVEEVGWTGFAIPRLRGGFSVFKTGLGVGFLWGVWHFMSNIWGSGNSSGPVPLALFMAGLLFTFLPPYRILMVWVYDRTGSLLIAILMHACLDFFWLTSMPPGMTAVPLMIWYLTWAAFLWIIVALVALKERFSRRLIL